MKKINKVELLNLLPTIADSEVWVKLYRLWEPEPVLIWEGYTALYTDVRPPSKKNPGATYYISISPKAIDWAEYDQGDFSDEYGFVVEDYLMEVWR
ncbi:MAG TPA: hypothetical protein PKH77_24445 [Anaerolineae bacterium]|nr:hypothetical protein [Anaerolineae bacterium]